MKRFLIVLAVVSLILSAASGVALADDPWKCGVVDKVVASPSGDYDVVFRSTNCGSCVMVKMTDGRMLEWKYCEEDSRSWKDIPKRDQ
jgi:hypothetical protein